MQEAPGEPPVSLVPIEHKRLWANGESTYCLWNAEGAGRGAIQTAVYGINEVPGEPRFNLLPVERRRRLANRDSRYRLWNERGYLLST